MRTENMRASEQELRSALDAMKSSSADGYLPSVLAHFEELSFLPRDSILRCASLRACQRAGTGVVAIYFSPGGRVLRIVAQFGDPEFSSTITYQLPRELRPKGA